MYQACWNNKKAFVSASFPQFLFCNISLRKIAAITHWIRYHIHIGSYTAGPAVCHYQLRWSTAIFAKPNSHCSFSAFVQYSGCIEGRGASTTVLVLCAVIALLLYGVINGDESGRMKAGLHISTDIVTVTLFIPSYQSIRYIRTVSIRGRDWWLFIAGTRVHLKYILNGPLMNTFCGSFYLILWFKEATKAFKHPKYSWKQ